MRGLRLLFYLCFYFTLLLACSSETNIENSREKQDSSFELLVEDSPVYSPLKQAELEQENTGVQQEELKTTSVNIMAVGDIMMHMPQVYAGRTSSGYDFLPFFDEVIPIFAEADFVLGNLETTLAGAERGFSGYPQFNSPDELADALAASGFHVLTTANNHSLDTGEKGLIRTLDQLERVGVKYTGTYRSNDEKEKILILEKNDIRLAILAYTYGTNGIPLPSGKEYLVNLIEEKQMEKEIKRAKQLADIVIVSVHFGTEYQLQPNQAQLNLVEQLFAWGADIILGSHPHVLQPLEQRVWVTEAGEEREGVVIYSLGNFISNQRTRPRDIGGILSIKISKTGEKINIEEVEFTPTYVHIYTENNKKKYKVVPLSASLGDFPFLSESNKNELSKRYEETMKHVFPKNYE